ncbi:AAA family ATPase [Clostridium botulinum]|uniref:AAA family ATPase n=1 Tax=Clostridium botulinum TaxID=1491 RepID=UPI00174E7C8B|nr:AAA family ATPase [Clostridium botulinum]MBD5589317.1 AAA family ATPase [Clostridium botulinum]
MINILDVQPNKVSRDLTQYPIALMGKTGAGKTRTMKEILESFSEGNKKPLFLMFEDRYAGIPGIMAQRIRSIPDLQMAVQQLKNPKAKEIYSCIVIDTVQKFESMMISYTTRGKNVQILDDIGQYGKGTKYYRSNLQVIEDIKSAGFTIHYIAQAEETQDKDQNIMYRLKTNDKNTLKPVTQDAYLIGFLWNEEKDGNKEFKLTFKDSPSLPDLKDTFNLPKVIKYQDLKQEIEKAIDDMGEDFITDDRTINKEQEQVPFKEVIDKASKLGKLLYQNKRSAEADAVLRNNIEIDEEGNVPSLKSLIENQRDVAEMIVIQLQELVDKYELKLEE